MKKKIIAIAALAFAVMAAHATTPVDTGTCSFADIGLTAGTNFKCAGYFAGNLNNSNNATTITSILNDFTGYTWSQPSIDAALVSQKQNFNSNVIDFGVTLQGWNILSIHKGKGGKNGQEGTAFYMFDAGSGMDSFTFNMKGLSNAVWMSVPQTAPVPEPGSFLMLAAGLFGIGTLMRRRKQ